MNALILLLGILNSQAAPAEGTFDVTGVVRDEAGQPLEGVAVAALEFRRSGSDDALLRKTTTDAHGRFELEGLIRPEGRPVSVLALKRGYVAKEQVLSPQGEAAPIDWKLEPATPQTISILDPDGTPVEGAVPAEITFGADRAYIVLGGALLAELGFQSSAEGTMTLDITRPATDLALVLAAPRLGRQRQWFQSDEGSRTFRFRPAGSLCGTVTPPDGLSAEGVQIEIQVRGDDERFWGTATATVSADNTFRVPALMAGMATLRAVVSPEREVRPGPPTEIKVTAGVESHATVKLARAIRITGTVVELDSERPIAGVALDIWNHAAREHVPGVATDEQGRYTAIISPGQIQVTLPKVPLPYYIGIHLSITEIIKEAPLEIELKPFRVPRGMRREGVVVDEAGEPVAGAWVTAKWWEEQDRLITMGGRSAQADDNGRFVLEAVSSKVEIYLRADTPHAAGLEYTAVPVDSRDDIRLTVSPKGVAVLAGRVVDLQGKPVPGAAVQIHAGYRGTSTSRFYSGPGGQQPWDLTTDADGRFQTPQAVPRHLKPPGRLAQLTTQGYYTRVTAPGMLDGVATVTVGPEGEPFIIPDIVLMRESRVAGRVVDRAGKPLAGARVQAAGLEEHQTAAATADSDGRFTLTKVHPEAIFVFAVHEGFTFTGQPIPAPGSEVTFVLSRRDEAADEPPLVPRQPTPDQSAAALKKLLVPLWDQLDPKDHAYQRGEILERMAAHDPEWTLAKLAELPGPRYAIPVLRKLGQSEEALVAVAGLTSASQRSYLLLDMAREMPALDRRRELLGEAFAEARGIIEPNSRLAVMMRIAQALRGLGDDDAARRIVEDNLPEIENLEAGFSRGHIAETVALYDLDKALKLCEGATDEYERDRHPGNIAHALAAIDPEKAERAYRIVSDRNQYRYVPRVCYRMAPVDLPRAKAIAEAAAKTYGDQRPYAYGVMALALATKEPGEARRLLQQAFDLLHGDVRHDSRRQFQAAVALLRIAEIVDPAACREHFWRVVALAPGTQMRTAYEWEAQQKLEYNALLAVLLIRYGEHPQIARRLVQPLYTTDKLKPTQMRERIYPIALAMVDHDKAAAWLRDKYFAETKPEERRYIPQPQELMADAVSGDDEAFWKAIHGRVIHLWLPDEED